MILQAYYTSIWEAARPQLAGGKADIDLLIDSPADDRRGITLLARPPAAITAALLALLADFERCEPTQYYYPATDIHLTILSIISCYNNFALSSIDPAAYQQLVHEIVQDIRPFTIQFRGLTASAGAVMVQGFMMDDGLAKLREKIRTRFRNSSLQQSIDQRYSIQTAHSTLIRLRKPLANPAAFISAIEKYQHQFIGSFTVDLVELVYNDWYQRAANTVPLQTYQLQAS